MAVWTRQRFLICKKKLPVVIPRPYSTTHQPKLSSCSLRLPSILLHPLISPSSSFLLHSNFSNIQQKKITSLASHLWQIFAKVWSPLLLSASLCLYLYLCLSVCLCPAIPDMFQGSAPAKYGRWAVNKEDSLCGHWAPCPTVHNTHIGTHTNTYSPVARYCI